MLGLTGVVTLTDPDHISMNNGSALAAAIVVSEDAVGGTVNLKVFCDGPNNLRLWNVGPDAFVVAAAPKVKVLT